MTADAGRIAIVLPRKEAFARDRFGAIALTVEAYVRHSRFRDRTEILGMAVAAPRDPAMFRAIAPQDAWWRRRNLGFALGCAAYLSKAPPRHIDVHNRAETFLLLAERFPDAAVSPWFHNDPQGMRGAATPAARQRIADRAHRVICVSEWVRGRFLDGVARRAERVVVLPEGFDTETVTPAAKEKRILYVGRIAPEKGVLPLAQALAQILPALPDWRTALIGAGRKPGDDYGRRVGAALAPVADRVALPGFLTHERIMAEFAGAAIAIVPSVWPEPFGRTAMEAMAAGCAIIASPRGGLPDIVGDAGLLVEPEAAPLATAILALARDEAQRAELQRRARQRMVAAFDIRRWAALLDDGRAQ
ncbi:MAG TPA: glycosyltransferase family 4 protein [Stellaceae bacterium]